MNALFRGRGLTAMMMNSVQRNFATKHSSFKRLPVPNEPFVQLEHVNLSVGEHWTPELENFYFGVLGCAKDPRTEAVIERSAKAGGNAAMCEGAGNLVWANLGLQQFHLPVGETGEDSVQRVRGTIVLSWAEDEVEALRKRLEGAGLEWDEGTEGLGFVGPLGNRFLARPTPTDATPADEEGAVAAREVEGEGEGEVNAKGSTAAPSLLGPLPHHDPEVSLLPGGKSAGLGIEGVEFVVRDAETARKIGRFYEEIFHAKVVVCDRNGDDDGDDQDEGSRKSNSVTVKVRVGQRQWIGFRCARDGENIPRYDGHHIALYVNDFDEHYERARKRGLVYSNPRFGFQYRTLDEAMSYHEFRVKDIVDVDADVGAGDRKPELLFELEHEIRDLEHPTFSLKDKVDEWAARLTAGGAEAKE